ncbi:MAG: TonB-dependent receptor [Rhodospirillaceae bacterium]|nr:TonB-dependent receptor [Rhodospirillaceae bacterium]
MSHTHTETEIPEAFTSVNRRYGNVEAGLELPYVPRNRTNASVGLTSAYWGVYLSRTYESRMRDKAGDGPIPEDEGTDEFTVLDVAGHDDLSSRLRLTGRIDNVPDVACVVARRPFGARPGRPRAVQLGVTYRY